MSVVIYLTDLTKHRIFRHTELLKLAELSLVGPREMSMQRLIREALLSSSLDHIMKISWLIYYIKLFLAVKSYTVTI